VRKAVGIVSIAILFAGTVAASADECSDAVSDYNAVLSQLTDAAQHFSSCVANSLGLDSCAKEFNRLHTAYGEFQSAVTMYKKQCN